MPWGIAASAVIGLYSANKASKSANKAADNQQAAMDDQVELGREQLDFGKQQYADWKARFDPIMNDLETEAYAQQRPDYTRIAADNTAAFDASQGAARRDLERFGVNPADGAFADLAQRGSMQRALGLVTANTQARAAAKDATYNRLANLYAVGNGQQSSAMGTMNAAYSGLGSAFGNQASMYGNQFNNFTNQANAGYNDAATGIGYGLQSWLKPSGGSGGGGTVNPGIFNSDAQYTGPGSMGGGGFSWSGPYGG